MRMPLALTRLLRPLVMVLLSLAGILLVTLGCFLWIYTSPKTYAYRYLFPGIGAALIFVVFPMLYTIRIGFSNYSSTNLLTFPRATAYLLEETYRAEGVTFNASVHAEGTGWRLQLEDADSGKLFAAGPFNLGTEGTHPTLLAMPLTEPLPGDVMPLPQVIDHQAFLKGLSVQLPDGLRVRMTGLREFAPSRPQYTRNADGSLTNNETQARIQPNFKTGFYETEDGEKVTPGFQVDVGWKNYLDIFTDASLREPLWKIFIWTVVFSTLTVVFCTTLGMVLAVLLSWESLRFRSVYRLVLFLPYAIPGFISILVFKGLFNNNSGEINLVLSTLFGLKPTWFSDPFLAKTMILIVNTWLGFPYMMVICMGLIKAIPQDLYEASAVAGAGPLTNFFRITMPLILKPLTPLLISSFAFNFNNFVLINLLTGGLPDFLNTSVPAGTTDILVSYTYRMAFGDSGQKFALGAAISTVVFLLVAVISVVQIKATKIAEDTKG